MLEISFFVGLFILFVLFLIINAIRYKAGEGLMGVIDVEAGY